MLWLVLLIIVAALVFLIQSFSDPVAPKQTVALTMLDERPLTRTDIGRYDQYGYFVLGATEDFGKRFRVQFDVLFEGSSKTDDVHGMVWLSLFGDPSRESPATSDVKDDGGVRLLLLKMAVYQQKDYLDAFRNVAGVARGSDTEGWDLTDAVEYVPTSQWISITCGIDLEERTFKMEIDEERFTFEVPSWFQVPTKGGKMYIGGKTLKATGISVRNLRVF